MVAYGFVGAGFCMPLGLPRETERAAEVGVFLPFAAWRETRRRWTDNDWSVGDEGIAGGDGHPPKLKKSG